MNFEDGIRNENRAKKVITWSAIYLVTSWLSVLAEILNPNSDDLKITDLLYFFAVPTIITSIVFTWHWLRSVGSGKVVRRRAVYNRTALESYDRELAP